MVLRDAEDAGQRLRTARTAFRWAGARRHVVKASRKSGASQRGWPARVAPVARNGAGRAAGSRGEFARPSAAALLAQLLGDAAHLDCHGSSRGARVSSGRDGDFTPRRLLADFSVDRAHSAPATSAATTTIHSTAETRPTTSPTATLIATTATSTSTTVASTRVSITHYTPPFVAGLAGRQPPRPTPGQPALHMPGTSNAWGRSLIAGLSRGGRRAGGDPRGLATGAHAGLAVRRSVYRL